MSKKNNLKIGKIGENIALKYLVQIKKERILCRNYKCIYGEIDIITYKNKKIYLYEVKFRTTTKMGLGEESISNQKINKIIKTYEVWLTNNTKFINMDYFINAIIIDPNLNIIEFNVL